MIRRDEMKFQRPLTAAAAAAAASHNDEDDTEEPQKMAPG